MSEEKRFEKLNLVIRTVKWLLVVLAMLAMPGVTGLYSWLGIGTEVKAADTYVTTDSTAYTDVKANETALKNALSTQATGTNWLANFDYEVNTLEYDSFETYDDNGVTKLRIKFKVKAPVIVITGVKSTVDTAELNVKRRFTFASAVPLNWSEGTASSVKELFGGTSCADIPVELSPADDDDSGSASLFSQVPASVLSYKIEDGVKFPANMSVYFQGCKAEIITLEDVHFTGVTSMYSMFYGCPNLKVVNMAGATMSTVKDMSNMFAACPNLEWINFNGADMSGIVTGGTDSMFRNCSSLRRLTTPATASAAVDAKFSGSDDRSLYYYEEKTEDSDDIVSATPVPAAYEYSINGSSLDFGVVDSGSAKADLLKGKAFSSFTNALTPNTNYFLGREVCFWEADPSEVSGGTDTYTHKKTFREYYINGAEASPGYGYKFMRAYTIKYDRAFKTTTAYMAAYYDTTTGSYYSNGPYASSSSHMISSGAGYVAYDLTKRPSTEPEYTNAFANYPKQDKVLYREILTGTNVSYSAGVYTITNPGKGTNIQHVYTLWNNKQYNVVYHTGGTNDQTLTKTYYYYGNGRDDVTDQYGDSESGIGNFQTISNYHIENGQSGASTAKAKFYKVGYHINGWKIDNSGDNATDTGNDAYNGQFYDSDNSSGRLAAADNTDDYYKYAANSAFTQNAYRKYISNPDSLGEKPEIKDVKNLNLYANYVPNEYQIILHSDNATQNVMSTDSTSEPGALTLESGHTTFDLMTKQSWQTGHYLKLAGFLLDTTDIDAGRGKFTGRVSGLGSLKKDNAFRFYPVDADGKCNFTLTEDIINAYASTKRSYQASSTSTTTYGFEINLYAIWSDEVAYQFYPGTANETVNVVDAFEEIGQKQTFVIGQASAIRRKLYRDIST